MLIELTTKCSMGCTHCLSDCKPDGKDMEPDMLREVLEFVKKKQIKAVVFSGGEMFEHSKIEEILNIIAEYYAPNIPVSFTSNGRVLSSNNDVYEAFVKFQGKFSKKSNVMLQITDDDRFYPSQLDQKQKYRLNKLGAIIEGVPGNIHEPKRCLYPQGRALENFDESWWNTKAPKCVNARLITMQKHPSFGELCNYMLQAGFVCTPTIDPNGDIKLGESALCPAVANIKQTDREIMDNILNCKCYKCEIPIKILKETNPLGYAMLTQKL